MPTFPPFKKTIPNSKPIFFFGIRELFLPGCFHMIQDDSPCENSTCRTIAYPNLSNPEIIPNFQTNFFFVSALVNYFGLDLLYVQDDPPCENSTRPQLPIPTFHSETQFKAQKNSNSNIISLTL